MKQLFIKYNKLLINHTMTEITLDFAIDRMPTINNTLSFIINDLNFTQINDLNFTMNDMNFTINDMNFTNYEMNYINVLTNSVNVSDFIPFVPERILITVLTEDFQIHTEDLYCCVCMETMIEPTNICKLNCGHKYCNNCMLQHINANKNSSLCPLCRIKISIVSIKTNDTHNLFTVGWI